jgi:hypothetical protein
MTLHRLPTPARTPPAPRFRLAQAVLTPENKVAIIVGQVMRPEGLMAFIVDAATPAGKRRSRMVSYDALRPAPCGGPRLVHPRRNSRNPFAPADELVVDRPISKSEPRQINGHRAAFVIVDDPCEASPVKEPVRPLIQVRRRAQVLDDGAPLPAFLREGWARDALGRKLSPYPARLAALAMLAFRIWPGLAARHFDVARTIEAARTGALVCGPNDQSILARIASTVRRP